MSDSFRKVRAEVRKHDAAKFQRDRGAGITEPGVRLMSTSGGWLLQVRAPVLRSDGSAVEDEVKP